MSEQPQKNQDDSVTIQGKKKTSRFYGYFSVLFTFCIGCGAAIWEIYAYAPAFYIDGSLIVLVAAGIVAYIILSKTLKI